MTGIPRLLNSPVAAAPRSHAQAQAGAMEQRKKQAEDLIRIQAAQALELAELRKQDAIDAVKRGLSCYSPLVRSCKVLAHP